MSWEHAMAKELNNNRNRNDPVWFTGEVLSPWIEDYDEDGKVITSGDPVTISAFGGDIILKGDQLKALDGVLPLWCTQKVALLGNPFGRGPGNKQVLILGVIEDVV